MRRGRIEELLSSVHPPDELAAGRRAWGVVRAGFDEREPVRWPRRRWRPAVAVLVVLAVVAAVLTPRGRAVLGDLREAIGRERDVGVERAEQALFSLPARGRLLADSRRGAWILQPDGSKRLLGRYREPTWSPHGLYVAAIRGDELVTLDPKGQVRWSLARPRLSAPTWTGTRVDTRIAYLSRRELRIVGGDGRGDRLLRRNVAPVAPAWRPWPTRQVAFVHRPGLRMVVVDADTRREIFRTRVKAPTATLEWSDDGRRLLVADGRRVRVFTERGRLVRSLGLPPGRFVLDVAFRPGSRDFAYSTVHPPSGRGRVLVFAGGGRQVWSGAGWFVDLSWSPNGRWLAFSWHEANQWVFLRLPGLRVRGIKAVSNIKKQIGLNPRLAGWCCSR